MDTNEAIVQAWLETKGFLVRGRLPYDLSEGTWSSVSDVDLLAYAPKDSKKVAVLVTAWMTQNISPSHIKPGGQLYSALKNFSSTKASQAIEDALGISEGERYERWWVVGHVAAQSRQAIEAACQRFHITRILEFREVMRELVEFVRDKQKYLPHESEALQTIRALVWCGIL